LNTHRYQSSLTDASYGVHLQCAKTVGVERIPLVALAECRYFKRALFLWAGVTSDEAVSALVECFPEAGEGRRAASRVLHHPPVPQPVEHLRLGTGPYSCATPDVVGADV
jgi:hypothetical protein